MSRRALAALVLPIVMLAAGCGDSKEAAPDTGATASPVVTEAVTPSPVPGKPGKGQKAATAEPSVAPEKVAAPSTTDAKSAALLTGDWQKSVIVSLRGIDARLVADQPAAVKKVRATCKQMETGMFSTKVVPIIQKRFSSASLTVTADMAQQIYTVLLQDACYSMKS